MWENKNKMRGIIESEIGISVFPNSCGPDICTKHMPKGIFPMSMHFEVTANLTTFFMTLEY